MEKKYDLKKYGFNYINSRIIVPSFQRSIVWENNKQRNFIKSVIDGNPFGCILVSEKNKNDEGKYYLIDGLQRITTLRQYQKKKYDFLDSKMLNEEKLTKIILRCNKIFKIKDSSDDIKKKVEKLQRDFFKIIANKKPITEIFNNDKNDYILCNDAETVKCLKNVKNEFQRYTDISSLKIPTIVYTGNDLADVFVTLNTTGIKLTKYDTFAASWPVNLIAINDEEIISKVIGKYNELEKYDFLVEKDEDDITENGITLFEYCYALGAIISEKHPILFPAAKNTTNPCGFEIVALICGITLGSEDEIKNHLNNATPDFLVNLKNVICDSITVVENILKDWIIAKNGKYNVSDRTYMIYHIIMCYIKLVYSITIDSNKKKYIIKKKNPDNYDEELVKFKKYLPYHYFLDSISGFWTLHRQVSDLTTLIINNSKRYFSKPNADDIEKAFKEYIDSTKDIYEQKVSFENKLIIDYLLKLKIEELEENSKKEINELFEQKRLEETGKMIDFEHIVSKKKFEHIIGGDIKDLCKKYKIYSLGNLCYLDSKSNRAKGGWTVYEFKGKYDVFLGNVEKSNYLSAINYPKEYELEFVNEKKDIFIDEYNQFITNREESIIKELKKLLNDKLKNKPNT